MGTLLDSIKDPQQRDILLSQIQSKYTILDNVLEGCQIISHDFFYVYVNDEVIKQGHTSRENLIGHRMAEVYPGIETTSMFENINICMQQKIPQRIENQFTYPDSTSGWFELRMEPIEEGVLIFSFDITDQKKLLLDLTQTNNKFHKILENCKDIVHIMDSEGNVKYVTPSVWYVLGYTPEEFITAGVREYIHPDDVDSILNKLQELVAHPGSVIDNIEERIMHKDGYYRIMQISAVNVLDAPEVGGIVVTSRDVTTYKEKEEKILTYNKQLQKAKNEMQQVLEDLQLEKNRLQNLNAKEEAIVQDMGDGLIATDNKGNITAVNKQFKKLFHIETDPVGKNYKDLFQLEDNKLQAVNDTKDPMNRALLGENIFNKMFYCSINTIRIPIAITASPVNVNGNIIGSVGTFRDISKDLEIEKAKNEFISLASHQLRTPLGITKWYIEALKEEGYIQKAPDGIQGYVDELSVNNERILSLVRELLSVSHIDQGKINTKLEKVNIITLIRDIIKDTTIIALKKNVTISFTNNSNDTLELQLDKFKLQEAIENLIINAVQYNKESGKVFVVVKKMQDNLIISVKDTGIGVAHEDEQKIFTKFYRTQKALEKNAEGSGLGLYIAKSYIESLGGNIQVQSQEGKGATFTIILPMQNQEEVMKA